MAFTKINAAGIGTTERVTVDGLTVINNLSVGGTVSIAGTLTYEDVTNVDAVGLITARGGVFISAGSSIGIGSAAPTAPIDIHSSNNTLGIVSSTNNGANFDIFDNDTQSRIRTVDGRLHLYADFKNNTPDSAIRFFVDSSNEVARISSSGVGIGTTNPVSLLTLGKSPNPSIRFKDYTNNAQAAITCGANGQLVFQTDIDNGVANSDFVFRADGATTTSEIIRFKNTGNVGIGTDNPDGNLHVFNSSAGSVTAATDANNLVLESAANVGMSFLTANDALARIKFGDPDATNAGIIVYSHDGDSMRFHTATTERLRISSDGRLLVNTTAARNVGGAVSRLIEVESSGGGAGISIVRNQNTASCSTLDLGKSRGYPHTIVQSGDKLGIVNFCGADGTDLQTPAAQIVCEVDGTPGADDMPGRLIFKTNGGTTFATERLQITSTGNIISNGGNTARIAWGTTGGVLYSGFSRYDGAAQDVGISHYATTNAGTSFVEHFRMEHNGTLKATDTSIGSLSDSRLKKDIKDYSYDISKFKQFKPKSFNWINPEVHGDKSNVKGFLAQDVEVIDSDWVEDSWISKDDPDFALISNTTDINGAGETVGVSKMSKFGYKDAMYISVIQQLIGRIETLETKVAALEG